MVRIRVAGGSRLAPALVQDLAEVGTPVSRMEVVGPTLDDVFLDLTGRSLREDAAASDDSDSDTASDSDTDDPGRGSSMSTTFVADTANVLTRELRPLVREPFGIVISLMQPLVFLALFAPLLPDLGPVSALQWFVPGIVAMSCLMGSSMVGASLMQEMFTGSHERLLVSPLRGRRSWSVARCARSCRRWPRRS